MVKKIALLAAVLALAAFTGCASREYNANDNPPIAIPASGDMLL